MEGEREGEKHQCVVASLMPPTGDLARNPGTCPDWRRNQGPFSSQTLWFTGWHSVHGATPARALYSEFKKPCSYTEAAQNRKQQTEGPPRGVPSTQWAHARSLLSGEWGGFMQLWG